MDESQEDLKNLQNGFFKGISSLVLTHGTKMKLMKWKTGSSGSGGLLDIAKVKFMEAQGTLIQYLSVPCNILLMVLNSGLQEVTKVPLSCFLQTATTSWKSMRGCWTVGVLAS